MTASSSFHRPRRWADPQHRGLYWASDSVRTCRTGRNTTQGERRASLASALSKNIQDGRCGRELRRLKHARDGNETPIARSIRMEDLAQAAFAALDARVAVGSASGRTVASYRQRWRTDLAPRIGRRKLNEITKRTVLSLRDELRADGLQESSIVSVLVVLFDIRLRTGS